jgi:hypothetical protein
MVAPSSEWLVVSTALLDRRAGSREGGPGRRAAFARQSSEIVRDFVERSRDPANPAASNAARPMMLAAILREVLAKATTLRTEFGVGSAPVTGASENQIKKNIGPTVSNKSN